MQRPLRKNAPWGETHAMHATPRSDDGSAFIADPGSGPARTNDDLAESLAEEFVASALSGEEVAFGDRDQTAPEEYGGPYLEERLPEDMLVLDEVLAVEEALYAMRPSQVHSQ